MQDRTQEAALPKPVTDAQEWCRKNKDRFDKSFDEKNDAAHRNFLRDYDRHLGYVRVYVPGWKPEERDNGGFG